MVKHLWITLAAAALSAVAALLLQAALLRGLPAGPLVAMTTGLTLFLAAAAAILAWRAHRGTEAIAADLTALAHALDAAARTAAEADGRQALELAGLQGRVSEALGRLAPAGATGDAAPAAAPSVMGGGNVLQHPAARRSSRRASAPRAAGTEEAAVEAALARLVRSGVPELSLQPIVSVSEGAARGFEAFLHLELPDGRAVDIRRLRPELAVPDQAAIERAFVEAALEASRRRLGDAGAGTPLHVAVSERFLGGEDLAAVLDAVRRHAPLAASLMLSLPAAAIESGRNAAALSAIARAGLGLAIEDWPGSPADGLTLRAHGATHVKIASDRLLDRTRQRRTVPQGIALLEAAVAAGIVPVATDVRSDEDALALLDLGVDLMSGDRFSGPKRLRPEPDERLALPREGSGG